MKDIIRNIKEEGTVKNILKNVWVKRLGLVVSGMILATILFKPSAKVEMIHDLSAKNEELTINYYNLNEDYNTLKKDYNILSADTAGWRELTEEQQQAALAKAEEDRQKAEAEAKAKAEAEAKAREEAERKAAEEKAKQEAAAKANQAAATSQSTEAQLKQIIEDHTEEGGLINFSFTGGQIKATVTLTTLNGIPAEDMAVNRYSALSDELLNHEGWEILTVSYVNVGTISMNRSEKETNEAGDYFPMLEIEERLQ